MMHNLSGFEAMGHPVPYNRRERAYIMLKEIGMDSTADRMELIGNFCKSLEEDKPYEAMQKGQSFGIDLTGTYRLLAYLLTPAGVSNEFNL